MYYDVIKGMGRMVADAYSWEEVDGQPRYRWYKGALNSVYMISDLDDKFDIDHCDFSDLGYWYDCTLWVATNDEEALVYIYKELIPSVTEIVKEKYIANLSALGYFKPCALAKKHLKSHPVPMARTIERKKGKAKKHIAEKVVRELDFSDSFLVMIKRDAPDKLVDMDKDMQENIGKLLSLEYRMYGEELEKSLDHMEWLRVHASDELVELFSFEISQELKEQFIEILTKYEFFTLRNLLEKSLTLRTSPFYFEIPIYQRTRSEILSDYFDMNEEDDD